MSKQSSDIPFEHRVFSSKQTQLILNVRKTKFFREVLPSLKAYLDGNKLQITGQSILDYQEKRLAEPRQPRPVPQRIQRKLGESGAAAKTRRVEARP